MEINGLVTAGDFFPPSSLIYVIFVLIVNGTCVLTGVMIFLTFDLSNSFTADD